MVLYENAKSASPPKIFLNSLHSPIRKAKKKPKLKGIFEIIKTKKDNEHTGPVRALGEWCTSEKSN